MKKKKVGKVDHVRINITKEENPGQEDSDSKASRQLGLEDLDDLDDDSPSTHKRHRLRKKYKLSCFYIYILYYLFS